MSHYSYVFMQIFEGVLGSGLVTHLSYGLDDANIDLHLTWSLTVSTERRASYSRGQPGYHQTDLPLPCKRQCRFLHLACRTFQTPKTIKLQTILYSLSFA